MNTLNPSGVHFPKAKWSQIPSLPTEFNRTCDTVV